jgi:O-glycosyl hydrolase
MTWADIDGSFVFSFGHCTPWTDQAIPCQRHVLEPSSNVIITPAQVCNLSTTVHAAAWQQRIQDFGKDAAKSSLLYEGTGFFMRMHLHDHDPAHVHIYPRRGDTGDRIARVRIDNCDKLDGSLSSAMDHDITDVITRHRKTLLEGWESIKAGKLPLKLG